MRYVVVTDFTDKNDKHIYRVGDEFPHSGADVSAERVAELTSKDNMRGKVLIKAIDEELEAPQEPEIQPVSDKTEVFDEIIDKKEKSPKKRKKKEK